MNQIEQCPKCGSFTEGFPVYEIKRQGVRTGVKFATKKVLIYLITPIVGTFIFPVFGTILGVIIAFVIASYVCKTAENITDSVDLSMYSSTPFEFSCPHCGVTWNRTYEKGVDFTTDSVLEWQKDGLVDNIRSDAGSARTIAIITGIISIPCAFYCLTHLTNQSEYLLWWLVFIIGMPALCITISNGIKSYNKNQEADELENMTISEFRHSPYRAGNPFVGVVKPLDENIEPQSYLSKTNTPLTQESNKLLTAKPIDSPKDNLIGLFEAGIISSEEYAELEKREEKRLQTATKPQSVIQVENNKIDLLRNLKSLLDSEILSPEEYRIQKNSILCHSSIPMWKDNKTKFETLIEVKSLLDEGVITQKEFDYHKKNILDSD